MKHLFRLPLLLLALLLPATTLAHDFEVDGIYYNINGNEATVTYKGTSPYQYYDRYLGDVTIPASVTYGGTTYSVTSIGNSAFYRCSGMTSIDIPNSVTSIGYYAFYRCTDLTSIDIPNSVTTIGQSAFLECSGLTSISIGNSVTSIGDGAFNGCSGLTSITIPNSVTSIGYGVFSGCAGLTSLIVDGVNPTYDSRNSCNAIIETASNKLIVGCQNTTIPNSVTSIGEGAFSRCSGLTSITIPNSVTTIGNSAFSSCSSLTSITIPNSVTTIGDEAFIGCTSLTSIDIPNSMTTINYGTFCGCTSLTNVTIPNSVKILKGESFSNCSSLTSIDIPNSVTYIGSDAFSSTVWYDNQPDGLVYAGFVAYKYKGTMPSGTSIIIRDGTLGIGELAFYNCSGLTSITIPNSVTSIGSYAFDGTLWYNNQPDGLVYAGLVAYKYKGTMPSGTSITLKEGTLGIAENAFAYYSDLTSINIPNSVISISEWAFFCCDGLNSIQVASGNLYYDSRNNCNAIIETASNSLILGCKKTVIPSSVTTIGHLAFGGCNGLTNITIPNSVTSIGDYAFMLCSSLTEIYNLALMPPEIYSSTFNDCHNATLYVPEIALDYYQNIKNWKYFANIVGMPYTFEVDGTNYHATTMNTASVMANGDEAILYSGYMVIPDSVTYEGYTFAVTGIEGNAFDGCFELTSITIPNSVETIGEQAFQGCTGLTSVTIGSGVTAIGAKAFNYCNALETVKCLGTVPPVMASSDCFTTAAYNRATLLVPRNTEATYSATDYWYKFAHIEGWGSAGQGDVNGDGVMSITDVTALIDVLLGHELDSFYFDSADLNSNGRLDIGDVTSLIDNLLNGDY